MQNFEIENLIETAFGSFENFEVSRKPYNVRCKCHICGDSRRDRSQSRLNAYYYNSEIWINCYNCGYSSTATYYLYLYHAYQWNIYNERQKELRLQQFVKNNETNHNKLVSDPTVMSLEDQMAMASGTKQEPLPSVEYPTELPLCYCLTDIADDHAIVKYVNGRMIPEDKWHRLFYTTNFRKLSNIVVPNTFKYETKEPRLVIPIYNASGHIESFQGRALRYDAKERYITIKYSEEATKIYGLDTVDKSKTAYFLEGQLDSLFIDNGMAITGGNISLPELDKCFDSDRAFIMDNENRHPDTIKRIEKFIMSGEKIVLFDRVDWEGKDINQFVIDGIPLDEINDYIRMNTIEGVEAQLRFGEWKKVDDMMVRMERKQNYRNEKREQNMQHFLDKIKGRS